MKLDPDFWDHTSKDERREALRGCVLAVGGLFNWEKPRSLKRKDYLGGEPIEQIMARILKNNAARDVERTARLTRRSNIRPIKWEKR